MIDNLKIYLFGNFMIIGKEDGRFLLDPRMISMSPVPGSPGQAMIILNQIIGKPEKIEIENIQAFFTVRDETVISFYLENISGLTLPQQTIHQ
jgi:hypothetical protein